MAFRASNHDSIIRIKSKFGHFFKDKCTVLLAIWEFFYLTAQLRSVLNCSIIDASSVSHYEGQNLWSVIYLLKTHPSIDLLEKELISSCNKSVIHCSVRPPYYFKLAIKLWCCMIFVMKLLIQILIILYLDGYFFNLRIHWSAKAVLILCSYLKSSSGKL